MFKWRSWALLELNSITQNNRIELSTSWTLVVLGTGLVAQVQRHHTLQPHRILYKLNILGALCTRLLPQVQVQVVKKNLWCSGSRDRYDLVTFCLSSSSYDSMQPLWSGIYHFMTNIIIFIINCVAYLRPVVLPPSNSPKQQRPGRILLEIRSLPPT